MCSSTDHCVSLYTSVSSKTILLYMYILRQSDTLCIYIMNSFVAPLFFFTFFFTLFTFLLKNTYFYYSLKSIPDMLAWAPYVTPSKFAYDGLIKNELCNGTLVFPKCTEMKEKKKKEEERFFFSVSALQSFSLCTRGFETNL